MLNAITPFHAMGMRDRSTAINGFCPVALPSPAADVPTVAVSNFRAMTASVNGQCRCEFIAWHAVAEHSTVPTFSTDQGVRGLGYGETWVYEQVGGVRDIAVIGLSNRRGDPPSPRQWRESSQRTCPVIEPTCGDGWLIKSLCLKYPPVGARG